MPQDTAIFCFNDKINIYGQGDEYLTAKKNSLYRSVCPYCKSECKSKNDEMWYSGSYWRLW
jgi:hypothetical protein